MEERLQKLLAKAGIASRRSAEQLIRDGRIQVNGQVVTNMGCKADPSRDCITFDGRQISSEQKMYILLNKPAGYVTTLSDPQKRPVVTDLVADIPFRLFPVGRLDIDTEGALLMTNDGALTNTILHPRFEIKKTYEALVSGIPSASALKHLSEGIEIDGVRTRPAKIRVLKKTHTQTLIEVVIHEGRKRQVRKMFQAIHHKVLHLKRVAYGKLTLGNLASGKYKTLSAADIKKIFS
ncbi:MAG: rRNA pseudouridine synthase [Desulfobulbus sp.]|nr:rRNA pseudouridine synthase [Desulfobulbus sp.]